MEAPVTDSKSDFSVSLHPDNTFSQLNSFENVFTLGGHRNRHQGIVLKFNLSAATSSPFLSPEELHPIIRAGNIERVTIQVRGVEGIIVAYVISIFISSFYQLHFILILSHFNFNILLLLLGAGKANLVCLYLSIL